VSVTSSFGVPISQFDTNSHGAELSSNRNRKGTAPVSLENVVDKLRKRALGFLERKEKIGEENTKAALIEPLLSALGWEIEELEEVHREYRRKGQDRPVDYALFLRREPRLFIEAKALDEDLTNRKWASQILSYATVVGVEWCVLTDGDEYRLFNAHAPVDIEEKLFRSIRISISDEAQQPFTFQTLELLSKEKMRDNLLNTLWKAEFLDRKIKGAVEGLFKNEDPGLIRLLRKKTTGLGPAEIRASLKRASPIRIDFPIVPISETRKPICEPLAHGDAHVEKLSAGKKAALTRKARRLAAGADQVKGQTPAFFDVKLSDLIEARVIQTPLHLEREYKGVHLKAVIQNDGTVTFNGETYDSLSMAGGMARKFVIGAPPGQLYPQTNGWIFWKFQGPETGKLLEIDVLRQKYLKRSQHGAPKA
jgi:Restriction Enzyme Adenine Methylase Associated/Type I restriction enzyme R protein N terminus (HSDR_N)